MKKKLLVAACASIINQTSERMVLIPEGIFKGVDGRPYDAPHWYLSAEQGGLMVAALNQRTIDMVVDYEHGTLKSKETGLPAPASGWLHAGSFEYVPGLGICTNSWQWTVQAQAFLDSEEYRYLSPVFSYDRQGNVDTLLCVALTNTPNLDNLPEAQLAAAAQDFFTQTEDSQVNEELLERLRWMLNLSVAATAEDIMAELAKLQSQISEKTSVTVAQNGQNLFDAVAAIDGLKVAANSQIDPRQYVPKSEFDALQTKYASLSSSAGNDKADTLIAACSADGRLHGVDGANWARNFIEKYGIAEFETEMSTRPKIAALNQRQTQTIAANSQQQKPGQSQYTADDLAVANMFGHVLPTNQE